MGNVPIQKVEATQSRRVLAEGLGVTIEDFRCRAHVHTKGPEEANVKHSIVFIRRGVFVRQRGRESVVADANHILFFNAGEPYHIAHPVPGGDDCTVLSLSKELAREIVAQHAPRCVNHTDSPFPFGFTLNPPRAARLHLELLRAVQTPGDPRLEEVLIELMETAVWSAGVTNSAASHQRGPITAQTAHRHRQLAEAAMVAICGSIASPPSLPHLARTLGCSAFHLSRVFRSQVGLSMRAYRAQLRARVAAERLRGGERNLTDLALDLGYTDHSHFTKAFRQEWRLPPSAVRAWHHGVLGLQELARAPNGS